MKRKTVIALCMLSIAATMGSYSSVMAEEKRAKRQLDELNEQINKMQKYAEKALIEGNESDAKLFLEKKNQEIKSLVEQGLVYI